LVWFSLLGNESRRQKIKYEVAADPSARIEVLEAAKEREKLKAK